MHKNFTYILIVILAFTININAQFGGFSHEIGVIAGPTAFQSDYGERRDLKTTAGNTGLGIGLIHIMNFSYTADCDCYTPNTYFNDHFKIRSEISYNKTNLQHFGRWVDNSKNSVGVQQLRAMRGSSEIIDLGMQLEFYPWSIRDFTASTGSFGPFISLGAHYNYYNPEAYSLLGPLDNPVTTFPKYIGATSNESGSTWSIVSSIGARYKLAPLSDLMVDLRFQQFFTNWADGLNPDSKLYPENRSNDWMVWFNVGYIYYLP